jgi:hypothetical protein
VVIGHRLRIEGQLPGPSVHKYVESRRGDLQSRGMATRPARQTIRAPRGELDLYSWRGTRPGPDISLRSVLEGAGKVADLFLTLIPALVAVLFILQAVHMAESMPQGTAQETARVHTSVEEKRR